MSAVLNIASAALILPNLALASFLLAVGFVAERNFATLAKAFWNLLSHIEYLPLFLALALAAIVFVVVAVVKVAFLFPLAVVLLGGASSAYVIAVAGLADAERSPFLWLALAGVALGALQLWRLAARFPPAALS